MSLRVKICGITRVEDALYAASLGAHALGFIFAESPRRVSPKHASAIIRELPPFVTPVGVFVNEPLDDLRETVRRCGLGAVQLHGDEDAEYAASLEDVSVIKAVRVKDAQSLEGLDAFNVCALLLDTYSKDVRGGTGHTFNWDLAVQAKLHRPMILSGGLNPENIAEAVTTVRPYGVDVSSGVEASPGTKDHGKLRALFAAISSG